MTVLHKKEVGKTPSQVRCRFFLPPIFSKVDLFNEAGLNGRLHEKHLDIVGCEGVGGKDVQGGE